MNQREKPATLARPAGALTSEPNPDVVVLDDDDAPAPTGAPPTNAAGAPQNLPLEQLEKALENTCQTLHSLATNVLDFSYDSQNVIFSKVNEFVRDLQDVDAKAKLVDVAVPMEVLEAIDKGRNPDITTYQMLESSAEASSATCGKLTAMRSFREELETAVRENPLPSDDDAAVTTGEAAGGTAAGAAAGAVAGATGAAGVSRMAAGAGTGGAAVAGAAAGATGNAAMEVDSGSGVAGQNPRPNGF